MATPLTRKLITDSIVRIYKNISGTTIAIDTVPVEETRVEDGYGGFTRTATISFQRTKVNEGASQSRVVTTIQQIGIYDSFTETSGNYTEVVYSGNGTTLGDLTVDLSSLPEIGDSV